MNSSGEFDIITNMDETPCFLDMASFGTLDIKGVKAVRTRTTENEKMRFSVVYTAGIRKVGN